MQVSAAIDGVIAAPLGNQKKAEILTNVLRRAYKRGARAGLVDGVVFVLKHGNEKARLEMEILASSFDLDQFNVVERQASGSLKNIIKDKKPSHVLVTINMNKMPYSIGECLYMYVAANTLCKLHEAACGKLKIDVIFLVDPEKPDRGDQKVSKEQYFLKIFDLMATVKSLSNVEDVAIFGNIEHYKKYISTLRKKYVFWPPLEDVFGNGAYYKRNCDFIQYAFKSADVRPDYPLSDTARRTAIEFIRNHASDRRPVALHLRANRQHYDDRRNSDLEVWEDFLRKSVTTFPEYVFFVVCGQREAQSQEVLRLQNLRNVVIVKHFSTDVATDIALCLTCGAYLGGPSGPAVPVAYSPQPYVLFNFKRDTDFHFIDMLPGEGYPHATANQKVVWEKERVETVTKLFRQMVDKVDWTEVQNRIGGEEEKDEINMHVLN